MFWSGRHDDPIEKAQDQLRAEINASHRFNSFAAERTDCFVKWCVLRRCWAELALC